MGNNERGKLIVVSGFSGAGKGTLLKAMFDKHPDTYALSVSWTTRKPREKEVEGVNYYYRSQEEFNQKVAEDFFVEYALYTDNSYGTPRPFLEESMAAGKNVICEIEIQGALQIKEKFPDARLIFITTKDAKTLGARLRGRETETEEVVLKRLKRAISEADGVENYHGIVVNDELEASAMALHEMILRDGKEADFEEKLAVIRQIAEDLSAELK